MTAYTLNTEDYIAEAFDNDFVVLNMRSGVYFEIADRSAAVLAALLRGADAGLLAEALDARDLQVGRDARDLVRRLREVSALRIDRETGSRPEPTDIEAVLAGSTFVFVGFDDLSALILADPVHDLEDLQELGAGSSLPSLM